MFSPRIIKKTIFGIDINIEFDFWGSIFRAWQKIYSWRLFYFWSHKMSFRSDSTFPFIKFALTHLPNGSFVIFFFDNYRNIAVQFIRSGTDIHLVTPVWEGNEYEGKRPELSKLIKKSNIEKSAIYRQNYGKGKIDVGINFHENYTKAANFAILITKDLFHFKDPVLFEYETNRLVPK
jgi:hypothetical protein